MSLRDALVAKGLVSEKRAREVDRELKQARRQQEGRKKSKKERQAEETARARAEAERQRAERLAARSEREVEREAHEHRYRVRQIILAHRLGGRGRVPFHHRVGDTRRIQCLHLREEVARDLRAGRAAIAGFQRDDGTWEHHVVSEKAARKLDEIEPAALVHWVRTRDHLADPAEALLVRTWESTLGPHRLRSDAELRAWQGRG